MSTQSNTTLHYGGSLSSKGRLCTSVAKNKYFQTQKRYELIIRLENAQLPDAAIASMLVISKRRLQQLKTKPDYLTARMRITHGIIIDQENSLDQVKEQRRAMLTELLPPALQVIANELMTPAVSLAERKHKVSVAQDLMEREGSLAKITRTEIKPVENFDFERHDEASAAVLHALRGTIEGNSKSYDTATRVAEALNVASQFSRGVTLSDSDQQAALSKLEAEAELLGMGTLSDLKQ